MKKYLFAIILSLILEGALAYDSLSPRRMKLDSMTHAMRQRMQNLDTTIRVMDRMMDSITGKPVPKKIDTMALYNYYIYFLERNKSEQRQKEKLLWKTGILAVIIILAAAGWGRWRIKRR